MNINQNQNPINYINKKINSLISLFAFSLILTSCNSESHLFEPQFKVAKKSVYSSIHRTIKTEDIYIEGYKIPLDDTFDIRLTIQLINTNKLPINNDSITTIQKEVASQVKNLLKNPFQYKAYDIIFIQRDTIKGVIGTATSEKGLYPKRFYAVDL